MISSLSKTWNKVSVPCKKPQKKYCSFRNFEYAISLHLNLNRPVAFPGECEYESSQFGIRRCHVSQQHCGQASPIDGSQFLLSDWLTTELKGRPKAGTTCVMKFVEYTARALGNGSSPSHNSRQRARHRNSFSTSKLHSFAMTVPDEGQNCLQ